MRKYIGILSLVLMLGLMFVPAFAFDAIPVYDHGPTTEQVINDFIAQENIVEVGYVLATNISASSTPYYTGDIAVGETAIYIFGVEDGHINFDDIANGNVLFDDDHYYYLRDDIVTLKDSDSSWASSTELFTFETGILYSQTPPLADAMQNTGTSPSDLIPTNIVAPCIGVVTVGAGLYKGVGFLKSVLRGA